MTQKALQQFFFSFFFFLGLFFDGLPKHLAYKLRFVTHVLCDQDRICFPENTNKCFLSCSSYCYSRRVWSMARQCALEKKSNSGIRWAFGSYPQFSWCKSNFIHGSYDLNKVTLFYAFLLCADVPSHELASSNLKTTWIRTEDWRPTIERNRGDKQIDTWGKWKERTFKLRNWVIREAKVKLILFLKNMFH